VPGLHMYTLNLERSAVSILEQVGVLDTSRCVDMCVIWAHWCTVVLHTYIRTYHQVRGGSEPACSSVMVLGDTHLE
jgi:hypothetical protein